MHRRSLYRILPWCLALSALVLLWASLVYSPLTWDEGWNLCSARNWLESGFLGCRYLGLPTSPRMATSWVTIALSMGGQMIFGPHYLGPRLIAALQTLGAVLVLLYFAASIYGASAAAFSALVLLCISSDPRIHPAVLGSQILGEPTSLFCTLAGIALIVPLMTRKGPPAPLIALAIGSLFAVAGVSKIQFQPFLFASVLLPAALTLVRNPRRAMLLGLVAIATFLWLQVLKYMPLPYPQVRAGPAGTTGAFQAMGWVLNSETREQVLYYLLREFWFVFPSLGYCLWNLLRSPGAGGGSPLQIAELCLLSFVLSWFCWFLGCSIDFARYAAPPLFISSMWVGASAARVGALRQSWKRTRWKLILGGSIAALLVYQGISNVLSLSSYLYLFRETNGDMAQMAEYANSSLPPNAIIETYDAQMFHLLKLPYHYPPDQWSIDRIRAGLKQIEQESFYDPSESNASYLLVGPWSEHVYHLYEHYLKRHNPPLLKQYGDFKLYKLKAD